MADIFNFNNIFFFMSEILYQIVDGVQKYVFHHFVAAAICINNNIDNL